MAVDQSQDDTTAEVVKPVRTERFAVMNLEYISSCYVPLLGHLHLGFSVVLTNGSFEKFRHEDHR